MRLVLTSGHHLETTARATKQHVWTVAFYLMGCQPDRTPSDGKGEDQVCDSSHRLLHQMSRSRTPNHNHQTKGNQVPLEKCHLPVSKFHMQSSIRQCQAIRQRQLPKFLRRTGYQAPLFIAYPLAGQQPSGSGKQNYQKNLEGQTRSSKKAMG